LLLSLLCNKNTFSQTIKSSTGRNYYLNVKQFNEFVDRFNYKTDFLGNTIDSIFKSNVSREKYLELLFNNEDPRLVLSNDKYSDNYVKLKEEFIQEVVSNSYLIDKYSIEIIAEAISLVTYKNRSQEISVYLNQEIVNDGVKWVILSVNADFLNVLKQDTVLLRFIPPTSNETNFISLKRVFDDANFQHYYAYNGYLYDPLSTFLFAVNTGLVRFQYVNEIVYHIFDVNGWQLKVKEFNRATENSGWLIDDISRMENSFEELLEELIK
jgi:hypothetical protein